MNVIYIPTHAVFNRGTQTRLGDHSQTSDYTCQRITHLKIELELTHAIEEGGGAGLFTAHCLKCGQSTLHGHRHCLKCGQSTVHGHRPPVCGGILLACSQKVEEAARVSKLLHETLENSHQIQIASGGPKAETRIKWLMV